MKDWCHTNSILQAHYWRCVVEQVMFHTLITSPMTSVGHKANMKITISPSTFQLGRRSKAQNIGKSSGLSCGLVYSTTSKQGFSQPQNDGHYENFVKYWTQPQFDLRYEKIIRNFTKKKHFFMIASSMTSQGGLKVRPFYSFINDTRTFFRITLNEQRHHH